MITYESYVMTDLYKHQKLVLGLWFLHLAFFVIAIYQCFKGQVSIDNGRMDGSGFTEWAYAEYILRPEGLYYWFCAGPRSAIGRAPDS